ncbi:hypothetical protein ONZ45_g4029 [Pleurotus djamor]|nr:hypothetical protein ONZ45_g4029 [Pleurotus djamor]
MLDAFKLKSFDLEPVFSEWKDGPRFTGNPKKDLPVDEWLNQIKAGCVQRKVPQECWHKVGRHFMDAKPRARMDELKMVMAKVNGGNYRWNWKKFKIAMRNMGWDIAETETEAIKVQSKPSGIWWFSKPKTEEPESIDEVMDTKGTSKRPSLSSVRSDSLWLMRKNSRASDTQRPVPTKSKTMDASTFWGIKKEKSTDGDDAQSIQAAVVQRPPPVPAKTESVIASKPRAETAVVLPIQSGEPQRSNTDDTVTTIAHAPKWLINACNALDFLQTEHPKAMSTLSAVLITVGTLPATLVAAGVGGPVGHVLASGAAQAVSAVALGVGNLIKAQVDGQVQTQPANATATSNVR